MLSKHLLQYSKDLFVPPAKQIAALDGVRTLAILLVVGLHSNLHIINAGLPKASFSFLPPFQGGWIGVPLFFILSGYFIGSQLWREFERTGSVRVMRFVLRRGLRIWPLYYFVFFTSYYLFPHKGEDFWSNFFFVSNYLGDYGPIRGAWSLSTEEQFYILMPSLIVLLSFWKKRFSSLKNFRHLLYFLLIVPSLCRWVTWYYLTGFDFFDINLYRFYIYRPFHTHFDGLIIGLIFSNMEKDPHFKRPQWLNFHWSILFVTLILGLSLKLLSKVVFTYFSLAIIFGAFIWMVINRNNWLTRLLSFPLFYWTAKVSFGVYIVHHLVLWKMEEWGWFHQAIGGADFYLLLTYFVTFFTSSLICSVTYVLIEAPFIDWRNKILKGMSPSSGKYQETLK